VGGRCRIFIHELLYNGDDDLTPHNQVGSIITNLPASRDQASNAEINAKRLYKPRGIVETINWNKNAVWDSHRGSEIIQDPDKHRAGQGELSHDSTDEMALACTRQA